MIYSEIDYWLHHVLRSSIYSKIGIVLYHRLKTRRSRMQNKFGESSFSKNHLEDLFCLYIPFCYYNFFLCFKETIWL